MYIQKQRQNIISCNQMCIEKPHLHDPMPKMHKHSKCSVQQNTLDRQNDAVHFNQKGQTSNVFTDIELIPLELINSKRESLCRARESFYIEKAKTMHPRGIRTKKMTIDILFFTSVCLVPSDYPLFMFVLFCPNWLLV